MPMPGQPVPHQPIPRPQHNFTQPEIYFIEEMLKTTPSGFLRGCPPGFDTNIRLLGVGAMALAQFNLTMPQSYFNFNNFHRHFILENIFKHATDIQYKISSQPCFFHFNYSNCRRAVFTCPSISKRYLFLDSLEG